jgi:hypothetical protein
MDTPGSPERERYLHSIREWEFFIPNLKQLIRDIANGAEDIPLTKKKQLEIVENFIEILEDKADLDDTENELLGMARKILRDYYGPPVSRVPNARIYPREHREYLISRYLRNHERDAMNALDMTPTERIARAEEVLRSLPPNTGYDPHGLGNRGTAKKLLRKAKRNLAMQSAATASQSAFDPVRAALDPFTLYGRVPRISGSPLMGRSSQANSLAGGRASRRRLRKRKSTRKL